MMNMLLWNCRGVSSKGFVSLIGDLSTRYDTHFFDLFETHISGPKAAKVIKKFNFDGCEISDGEGFSGGIWCLWRKSIWEVETITVHRQFIHMKVKVSHGTSQRSMVVLVLGAAESCGNSLKRSCQIWKICGALVVILTLC